MTPLLALRRNFVQAGAQLWTWLRGREKRPVLRGQRWPELLGWSARSNIVARKVIDWACLGIEAVDAADAVVARR
jgi:hypothetical protein